MRGIAFDNKTTPQEPLTARAKYRTRTMAYYYGPDGRKHRFNIQGDMPGLFQLQVSAGRNLDWERCYLDPYSKDGY